MNPVGSARVRRTLARPLAVILATALFLAPVACSVAAAGGVRRGSIALSGDGKHFLGLKHSSGGGRGQMRVLGAGRPLKSSVDLTSQLPPVGDQGAQSSCVGWSTSYYYKSWSEKQEHISWDLNNPLYQYSPSFMYNQINGGYDGGATFYDAFNLLEHIGDVDMAEMPYNDGNYTMQPTSMQSEAAKPYRIPGDWQYFWLQYTYGPYSPPNDIGGIKAWLDSGKTLVMGIDIYMDFPDFWGNPPSSYYDYDGVSGLAGGHGVCICGYDDNANPGGADADHKGGFKMVNSWGQGWNGSSNGFVYLSYDFVKRYVAEAWAMNDLAPDVPSITGLSRDSAGVGQSVDITGNNFGGWRRNAKVSFNGTLATPVSFTNSTVTALVPAGAASGTLAVYNWEGTPSNSVAFTVAPPPLVDSVVPESGPPGTVVTVRGSNFGSSRESGLVTASSSYVSFNGVAATEYDKWSDTEIVCTVPEGATPGPVTVVVGGQSSEPNKTFTVSTSIWYLAEGSTDWGFVTYITIENPNSSEVPCGITYMTKSGPKVIPDVTLPPESQLVINPAGELGATDFSTRVEARNGKTIAVDRRMIWTGKDAPSPEGHASVGVTSPAKTWYLPEGSSKWGFETWLLIQNPNEAEAVCTVFYMIEGKGMMFFEHKVPAGSRQTFNMADYIGAEDASIKVKSTLPVIPERAMYRNNRREGHDSIGTTTPAFDYYLAEGTTDWGFTTYVLVQNPNNEEATVTITYMTKEGPVEQPPFSMPANSRKTMRVNDFLPGRDLSTRVHSDKPIIAERAMYWGAEKPPWEACHDSIGMSSPHTTFYLPDGETSNGHETWTLVQNPNDQEVEIEVSYLTPSGKGNVVFADRVPANSRKTYFLADSIPSGRAAVMVRSKTPGRKIMVERAMYWNSRGAGTDTIGGYSD